MLSQKQSCCSNAQRVRSARMADRALLAVLTVASTVLPASTAFGCGYHSPQRMARGLLNWVYPDALHVPTAVWRAELAGILPVRTAQQRRPRDMFGYHKTVSVLQEFGARLPDVGGGVEPVSFALLLIDSMLWVRFTPGSNGFVTLPHADGPAEGDAIVITEEKVVRALINGVLDSEQSEGHGLLRFYGNPERQEGVRELLMRASSSLSGARKASHLPR